MEELGLRVLEIDTSKTMSLDWLKIQDLSRKIDLEMSRDRQQGKEKSSEMDDLQLLKEFFEQFGQKRILELEETVAKKTEENNRLRESLTEKDLMRLMDDKEELTTQEKQRTLKRKLPERRYHSKRSLTTSKAEEPVEPSDEEDESTVLTPIPPHKPLKLKREKNLTEDDWKKERDQLRKKLKEAENEKNGQKFEWSEKRIKETIAVISQLSEKMERKKRREEGFGNSPNTK